MEHLWDFSLYQNDAPSKTLRFPDIVNPDGMQDLLKAE